MKSPSLKLVVLIIFISNFNAFNAKMTLFSDSADSDMEVPFFGFWGQEEDYNIDTEESNEFVSINGSGEMDADADADADADTDTDTDPHPETKDIDLTEVDFHTNQGASNEFSDLAPYPYFLHLFNKTELEPIQETDDDYDENGFTCVECDSRIDGNRCFHVTNIEQFNWCHSKIGQCYTTLINGEVVRGCVGDAVFPNTESTGLHHDTVKLCNNDALCNKKHILDTCIVCSGNNPECKTPNVNMEKACSLGKPSGCYLKKEENTLKRGCLMGLNKKERSECLERGSRVCQSCNTPKCNRKVDFDQKCYYCNGTIDSDVNCHTANPNHVEITCIGYASICVVGIDAEGYTHRQCSLNEEEDTARFAKGYELCYGDLCNSGIYPKDRQTCFKCNGDAACNNPSADLVGEHCPRFLDECFIYENKKDLQMYRGCMSDKRSEAQRLCNEKECYKCNTSDCNYLQSFQLVKPIKLQQRSAKNLSNFEDYENSSGHISSFPILIVFMGLLFTF
ncbi:uncharacterized protein LOC129564893 [Sitodiplosis mosellana]|uniref:uncharacterized protein LOC129564893 n=1 Tax=Sitodiplosis mosellana TaxID=263140 RepID=UPI0024452A6E|nr:uncharacterized protein LOC129564893 [Sitodiplosis mosellana]